jgi:hypothetical protein
MVNQSEAPNARQMRNCGAETSQNMSVAAVHTGAGLGGRFSPPDASASLTTALWRHAGAGAPNAEHVLEQSREPLMAALSCCGRPFF